MAGLLITAPRASAVSTIHVNCSRQDLQAKIDLASPGSIRVITATCHGNFHLAQDMTLKGTKSATLDGDDTGTTLAITGTPTVHLIGLIVTGGLAPAGGGINKAGGRLTLDHVTVEFNLATGQDTQGGGILSQAGSLRLTDSAVVHNRALSSRSGGASATGGGIHSMGQLTIIGSVLDANRAVAISSGNNSLARGGGISEGPETLTVSNSHIDGNHLFASGPLGAGAVGGGIDEASPSLSIADSTLSKNVATASGAPGAEVDGGGLAGGFNAGSISHSRFVGNVLSAESSGG